MFEKNPKVRGLTYGTIRKLKYVCRNFDHLYKETKNTLFRVRYYELLKALHHCIEDFCEDLEDLEDCDCLAEAGFDLEQMLKIESAIMTKTIELDNKKYVESHYDDRFDEDFF